MINYKKEFEYILSKVEDLYMGITDQENKPIEDIDGEEALDGLIEILKEYDY